MSLDIYDGQYGTLIFGDKNRNENAKVEKFFHEQIELFIQKIDTYLKIFCKVYVIKDSRPEPIYLVYLEKNDQDYFSNFKKESEKVLNSLDLKLVYNKDKKYNLIFDDIGLFDDKSCGSSFPGMDEILFMINRHKSLDFKAGRINDIIAFCKEILKNPVNESIGIYTGNAVLRDAKAQMSGAADINISLDKNPDLPLIKTDNTIKIFDDHKRELEKNRIDDNKRLAKNDFKCATDTAVEGIDKFVSARRKLITAGYSSSEMERDPEISMCDTRVLNKFSLINGSDNGSPNRIVFPLILLISGIVLGMIIHPQVDSYIKGGLWHNKINTPLVGDTPVSTRIPTNLTPNVTTPTPIPTSLSEPIVSEPVQNLSNNNTSMTRIATLPDMTKNLSNNSTTTAPLPKNISNNTNLSNGSILSKNTS